MRKAMGIAAALLALAGAGPAAANSARFTWFDYQGVEPGPAPPAGSYRNPVIAGYYPDPSVVRVGADFYLVNSSFAWFPGIPVWHSRDLVHWRQIGNAIDRPDQLDFKRLEMSRGVFAPQISYHAGRFYIINTCVDCGGNYVVTATSPAGPWSKPAFLRNVPGIDPSIFWDDDGSGWLVGTSDSAREPKYSGHNSITLYRFDPGTMTATPVRVIADAGVDPSTRPAWIEGPHLYKVDGRYYLMAAEGGTSTHHSEVIFRADRLDGPFVAGPPSVNPILTQRDLPDGRPDPITSTGHADLVRLSSGAWWAVFLGTRPYVGDLYNTGRETFLLPVTWHDGWPTILPHATPVPRFVRRPALPPDAAPAQTGSLTAHETFAGATLGREWMTMRVPDRRRWWLDHGLVLEAGTDGIGNFGHPSFVGRRQQHADATVTTSVVFNPAEGESAGIAAVQNDAFYLSLALTRHDGRSYVRLARRDGRSDPAAGRTVAELPINLTSGAPVQLRLHARGGAYDFDYATAPGRWQVVAHDVDGTNLSTSKAGGFVGTVIGPFAEGASRGQAAAAAPD